jgi:hypothetical protein
MALVFTSDKLKGLHADHDGCGTFAPSESTGKLELVFSNPHRVSHYGIEYLCGTCEQPWVMYREDNHDLIREVLKDNGIEGESRWPRS